MLRPLNVAQVHFELGSRIASQGQNSELFLARDLQLNADIAIKKIPKSKFDNMDEYFLEANLVHRSAHPNIVSLHYGCQDNENIFIAMPYYKNGSLKSRLAQSYLTNREIVLFVTQISSGLNNIHTNGLIHFDVKPDNILISDRNEAMISDFGLAKQMSLKGTAGQDRIYGKMSPPEYFEFQEFSKHFDIYQLGVTLHRMCVGDTKFYEEYNQYVQNGELNRDNFKFAIRNGQFPSRNSYLEHTPSKMISAIKSCLERDISSRFRSALEVVNAISSIEENLLDWRYSTTAKNRIWSKSIDERTIQLVVDDNLNSTASSTSANGKKRKIAAYCRSSITRQDIKKFLREH